MGKYALVLKQTSTWLASAFLVSLGMSLPALTVQARTIDVAPSDRLQSVIEQAQAGDVIRLAPGVYEQKLLIENSVTLQGPEDHSAIIQGDRVGRTIWIKAADVTIKNLTVTKSGLDLYEMDAGIFLDKTAHNAQILNNRVLDNSVGVYLRGPHNILVENNEITGTDEVRVSERGNGITLWNSPNSKILNNKISLGRDGIYTTNSKHNVFKHNHFSQLRYAVHYMYTNDSEVSENISIDNDIGYAIMFSERLEVNKNIAINSKAQGLMMNYANKSNIHDNVIERAEKCMYLYNANHNMLTNNHLINCDMGIHYTGAVEGNQIYDNAFIHNRHQVKYVGTRYTDWAVNGRGNYWSDNSAYDLNGDGIADSVYRPNDVVDQVVWRAPVARLLLNSPTISIVRWAQTQFPAILPGGLIDSAPIMKMPITQTWQRYKDLQR